MTIEKTSAIGRLIGLLPAPVHARLRALMRELWLRLGGLDALFRVDRLEAENTSLLERIAHLEQQVARASEKGERIEAVSRQTAEYYETRLDSIYGSIIEQLGGRPVSNPSRSPLALLDFQADVAADCSRLLNDPNEKVASPEIELLEAADPSLASNSYYLVHRKRFARTFSILREIAPDLPRNGAVVDLGTWTPYLPVYQQIFADRRLVISLPDASGVVSDWRPGITAFPVDLDKDALPLPDGSVSLVVALEVIEHLLYDPMRLVSEANRVLAPGGRLLLSTPNVASWRSILAALSHYSPYWYGKYVPGGDGMRHVHEYVPRELTVLLEAGGFQANVWTADVYTTGQSRRFLDTVATWGFSRELRGDTIFAVGVKRGPVDERYPIDLYDRDSMRPVPDPVMRRMKDDWNRRARDGETWRVDTSRLEPTDEEFFGRGRVEVESLIVPRLATLTQRRDPKSLRLLEIGCGLGRMTRWLAPIFGEIVATDVSGEMVARCRGNLGEKFPNIVFAETSGVDFVDFESESFDILFSAYVYQHVPTRDAIRANLVDAWRVLKPGGVFQFQTNGTRRSRDDISGSDTWCGEHFTEDDIRGLAREVGAQVIECRGAVTQHLWTVLRKPLPAADIDRNLSAESVAIDPVRLTRGDRTNVSLRVRGLDPDGDDCNSVTLIVEDVRVAPTLVAIDPAGALVEACLPASVPPGCHLVRVEVDGDRVTACQVEIPDTLSMPVVIAVGNDVDGGLDLHASGPKSAFRLFVDIPDAKLEAGVSVSIRGSEVSSGSLEHLPRHGYYMLRGRLPEGAPPGQATVVVTIGGRASPPFGITWEA